MLSAERVTNIDREVVRYDPLVIGTVNDVYKRMARAVGRIDQKVRNGEHLNDIETALFVGWDITKDGICLLTDRETVNPAFPLPANLQTDKFLATYKNPDTGEEYKAPTRLPVEYMIFYLDAEIAAAEGELIGVRGKKRQEIWDKINARLKEREVLKGNSVLLTEEQASLVTDAIHREAYLIGSNPVRTQEDDVKNHLKGEKIITKERRGLKLTPVDGNYQAPWDKLTWKDLEVAFSLPDPDKKIKTGIREIPEGVVDPNAKGCLSLLLPPGFSDLFTIPWNDINRWTNEPVEKRERRSWITVGRRTDGSRQKLDRLTDKGVRRWIRDIFDNIKYSSRNSYKVMADGLGEFGEDLKYSVPEPLRRRIDLMKRRFPEMELKMPSMNRRWLAALGLALLALATAVAFKSCEKPMVAPAGQGEKSEATPESKLLPDTPDYGTRGAVPNPTKTPQPTPNPEENLPETGFKGKNAEEPAVSGVRIEEGQWVRSVIENIGRRATDPDRSASLGLLLAWEYSPHILDIDWVKTGEVVNVPADLAEYMEKIDTNDPLINRINKMGKKPEAIAQAKREVVDHYKRLMGHP